MDRTITRAAIIATLCLAALASAPASASQPAPSITLDSVTAQQNPTSSANCNFTLTYTMDDVKGRATVLGVIDGTALSSPAEVSRFDNGQQRTLAMDYDFPNNGTLHTFSMNVLRRGAVVANSNQLSAASTC